MVTNDHSSRQFLVEKSFFSRSLAAGLEVPVHPLSLSIQQTVRDFRSESSEWEVEVLSLFNDVDRFLSANRRVDEGPAVTMAATVAEDVAGLKGLVEQQTEVLTALVNALTGSSAAAEPVRAEGERSSSPSAAEVDPFERLQQVVAAASV